MHRAGCVPSPKGPRVRARLVWPAVNMLVNPTPRPGTPPGGTHLAQVSVVEVGQPRAQQGLALALGGQRQHVLQAGSHVCRVRRAKG